MNNQDKEAMVSIVNEMAASTTGEQSTRHWAPDVLWYDIPPFASRGVQPAKQMFDKVFGGFASIKVEILDMDVMLSGTMGVVCTIQKSTIVTKSGDKKEVLARQTDCFEKKGEGWQLVHQHASVPAGGAWDGKITTA